MARHPDGVVRPLVEGRPHMVGRPLSEEKPIVFQFLPDGIDGIDGMTELTEFLRQFRYFMSVQMHLAISFSSRH